MNWLKMCFARFLGYLLGIIVIFFSLLAALLLLIVAGLGEWQVCEADE